jgi:predicted amidohydrolase
VSDRASPAPVRVAAIQMGSGPEVEANLSVASRLLASAAAAGARLAVLPENFACMPVRDADRLEIAEDDGAGPIQDCLARTASELGMWIVGGTIAIRCEGDGRPAAACLVFDDRGQRQARYDKIHLFDVTLPDREESYRESDTIRAGERVVVLDSPLGRLGLAVCYDLRFPELFRRLLDEGTEVIVLPAAFTAHTGRAHWETLLRARAIENLCWMVAAAQQGRHPSGRETWGDSMVVDPWGTVMDRRRSGAGIVMAEVDLARQARIRQRFPAPGHRKAYKI